jgi:hypothetical protein
MDEQNTRAFLEAAGALLDQHDITPSMVDDWAATRTPPMPHASDSDKMGALLHFLLRDPRLVTMADTQQFVVDKVAAMAAENQHTQARLAAGTAASGSMWDALGFEARHVAVTAQFWLPRPALAHWDAGTRATLQAATCRHEGGHWQRSGECWKCH